jgi:Ca2+-binding EF-hand superfamily protein
MKFYRAIGIVALAFAVASPAALAQGKGKGAATGGTKAQAHQQQKQTELSRQSAEQMRFYGMDKDNDGVITRAEWSGNDQSFREHDTNGDGVLSGDEVRPGGVPLPGQGRSVVRFDQADRNGDGRIARDEWTGNAAAFTRMDRNGDGVLTRDEFSTAFADRPAGTSGNGATSQTDRSRREDITARFNRVDRNGDGRIARDEWTGNAAAFTRMDRNGDGVITREEYSTAIANRPSGAAAPPNASGAYRAGYDKGMAEGRQAGREDKNVNGGKWDLDGQRELEQADSGYRPELGDRADYQSGYRAAFRLGYREGFGPRR